MVQLGLWFKTKEVEEEFIRQRKPLFQHFLYFIMFLLCFVIITVVTGFQVYLYPFLTITICVVLILVIGGITLFKNFRFVELFAVLVCLVVYLLFLDFGQRDFISVGDLAIGHFIGFFERVIVERLPMIRHKASYSIFVGVCRMALIRYGETTNFLFSGSLTLFGLLLDFSMQRKEREMFGFFYDSKKTLEKFQQLLKTYLSESILIIKTNLQEKLFTNDSFQTHFQIFSQCSSTKDFLEKFALEREESSRVMSSLKLEGEDFDDPKIFTNNEGATLYSYLTALQAIKGTYDGVSFDHIFNYIGGDSQETPKKLKIKAFHFSWDSQSAFVFVFTDITEHYSLINLKLADENKDKLVATVSHELRTPLNGILGMLQILQKEVTQPHLTKYIKTCNSSARLLLSLVNSILDSAQLKNNKLKLNPEKHKLKDILEDLISLFKFQCSQKQLYLKIDQAVDLPEEILTDRNRLSQILINLIGNALKFTFQGGITLVITQDSQDSEIIKFSVIDTGVGIHEKDKDNLFRMYGKLEGTANLNPQGVGLGLNISSVLAKLLNDNDDGSGIHVESELEKGSAFTFVIKKTLTQTNEQGVPRVRGKSGDKPNFSKKRTIREDLIKEIQNIIEEDETEKINIDIDESTSKDFLKSRKSRKTTISFEVTEKLQRYMSYTRASKNLGTGTSLKVPKSSLRDDSSFNSFNLDQSIMTPKLNLLAVGSPSVLFRGVSSSRRTSRFTVLVVDDNPFNLLVARELIEIQGFSVDTALNGQVAIDMITRRNLINDSFKLILMDCEMPVMDGFEATRILIEKMKKGDITETPIAALTANSVEQTKENCLKLGMVDCLSKPLLEADLKKLLEKYMY